jgi:hypothetical protein
MKTESFTIAQLNALKRLLGGMQSLILRLDDVDITKGRGILAGYDRCVWTFDGCRITIGLIHGGMVNWKYIKNS